MRPSRTAAWIVLLSTIGLWSVPAVSGRVLDPRRRLRETGFRWLPGAARREARQDTQQANITPKVTGGIFGKTGTFGDKDVPFVPPGADTGEGKGAGNGGAGDGGKKKNGGSGDGGGGNGGGRSIAFGKWYPMCLFIDGRVQGNPNAAVKKLVDDAAACSVNLIVFPVTAVPNLADDDKEINQYQQANCNINEAFGVPASSTSTCSGRDAPAKMCNDCKEYEKDGVTCKQWNRGVAGCAQLQAAGGGGISPDAAKQTNQSGGNFSGGGSAPSIEQFGACDGDTVAHEALGHSEMGQPNGTTHGKGIGKPNPSNLPTQESASGEAWTGQGCGSLYANAFENDGRYRWNPDKQKYYYHQTDVKKMWDMKAGKKLFKEGKPGRGPSVNPVPMQTVVAKRGIEESSTDKPVQADARTRGGGEKLPPLDAGHPGKKKESTASGSQFSVDGSGDDGKQVASGPNRKGPPQPATGVVVNNPQSSTVTYNEKNSGGALGNGSSVGSIGGGGGSGDSGTVTVREGAGGGVGAGSSGPSGSVSQVVTVGGKERSGDSGGGESELGVTRVPSGDELAGDPLAAKKKKKNGKKGPVRDPGSYCRKGSGNCNVSPVYESGGSEGDV